MKYAFFTGMGRSGTKFITSLLSQDTNATVLHEHIGNREFWLLSWYLPGDVYAQPYLKRIRDILNNRYNTPLFIDVNGYLQNCVPELQDVFKPDKVFHFVRNPKDVVRSLYTRRNEADVHIVPKTKPELILWNDWDKFTRICWNWANTTRVLLSQDTKLIKFEMVVNDYDYLYENILSPLQLNISRSAWETVRNRRVNETKPAWYRKLYATIKSKPFIEDKLPTYENWPDRYKKVFLEICGPVKKDCGY